VNSARDSALTTWDYIPGLINSRDYNSLPTQFY
jgi:hypothetical protein